MVSLLDTAVSDYACPSCDAQPGAPCADDSRLCLARLNAASGDRYVINACALAMLTYDSSAIQDWQKDIREKGY